MLWSMEPKFQTSFIPKRPITTAPAGVITRPAGRFNIFSITATILVIVTVIALGGTFAYKKILESDIAQLDQDINAAREAFQVKEIQDLIDTNSRITAINGLLEKHIVISKVFSLLDELTLKKVQFIDFKFAIVNNVPSITMKTTSQSYNALAVQRDVFSKSEFLINPKFLNYDTGVNGYITTTFYADIFPSLVSYKVANQSETQ